MDAATVPQLKHKNSRSSATPPTPGLSNRMGSERGVESILRQLSNVLKATLRNPEPTQSSASPNKLAKLLSPKTSKKKPEREALDFLSLDEQKQPRSPKKKVPPKLHRKDSSKRDTSPESRKSGSRQKVIGILKKPPKTPKSKADLSTAQPSVKSVTLLDDTSDKTISLEWFYQDANKIVHGPFPVPCIMTWIRNGFFDEQPHVRFQEKQDSQPLTLVDALPLLAKAQLKCDLDRVRNVSDTEPKASTDSTSSQLTPVITEREACTEFDGPLDLTKLTGWGRTWDPEKTTVFADTELILLPPRGELKSFDAEKDQIKLQRQHSTTPTSVLEFDLDWLQQAHPAFKYWATTHHLTTCRKALVIPVHSLVLKSASPLLMEALQKQELKQKLEEFNRFRVQHDQSVDALKEPFSKTTIKLYVRCTYPEAIRLILRFLYGSRTIFESCETTLLICAYYEARRLGIDTCADAIRLSAARVRTVDGLLAATELTETLEIWDLFEEFSSLLCDCAYLVFVESRYLQLGPLGLRRILGSNSTSIDEVQLFIAAHLWLMHWYKTKRLYTYDFWEKARALEEAGPTPKGVINIDAADAANVAALTEREARVERSFANQVFIFSGIRFCHMSPKQLHEARFALRLDALLVDGLLRKLREKEWPRRVAPWISNPYFVVDRQNTSFPITLRRVRSTLRSKSRGKVWRPRVSLVLTDPYATEFTEDTSHIAAQQASSVESSDIFWAWATGDPRCLAEACWAVEILYTKYGRLALGVASLPQVKNVVLPGINSSIPMHGSVVWYFNCQSREFYTAILHQDHRTAASRLSLTPSGCSSWSRSVKRGDILLLRVSVGLTTLTLTISLIDGHHKPNDPKCYATFNFPHQLPQEYRGSVSRRCMLALRPWYEIMDCGDTLGLPEFGLSANASYA